MFVVEGLGRDRNAGGHMRPNINTMKQIYPRLVHHWHGL